MMLLRRQPESAQVQLPGAVILIILLLIRKFTGGADLNGATYGISETVLRN